MSLRKWLPIALILILAAAAGALHLRAASWARIDAADLVSRAYLQQGQPSYIAHVTTLTGYEGKPIETHATVFHQGKVEKIEYSGASGRTAWLMTMDGKSYTYLPKGNRLLVSEMSRLLSDKDRTKLLLANYDAKCVGMNSIAGREAYIIELSPRHEARPAKKLWIDRENFAILRTEDYSASGDRHGLTQMNQVSFGAKIAPRTFVLPPARSVDFVMVCKSGVSADMFRDLGFAVSAPSYLPAGYELEGYHLLYSTCGCAHHSAQLTYTDGLNVISVFESPKMACCKSCKMAKCDDQNCGAATMGEVTRGDKTIVVVGDLLPSDLNKIAESVKI
jgi:negative regulator of sigma E activity